MTERRPSARPPERAPISPAEPADAAWASEARFVRIDPLPVTPTVVAAASSASADRRWLLWAIVMSVALLLSVLSLGVLLGQQRGSPPPVAPAMESAFPARRPIDPAASPPDGSTAIPTNSADAARIAESALRQRQAVEALAQRYTTARAALDARGLSAWDAAAAAGLDAQAHAARSAMQAQDLASAARHWQTALDAMQDMQVRADRLLQEALQAGEAALQAGDAESAQASFARALQIDPKQQQALAGQRRAANLGALRANLTLAEVALRNADFTAAEAAYREALALVPDDEDARRGLAAARTSQANSRFNALMSSGLAALHNGEFDAAERAFADAERLRPGASAARDGRLQVQLAREQRRIADLRAEAELAEGSEQWARAQNLYEQLLASDGALVFARSGRARAAERAALDARLQAHLEHPERLSENAVRVDAAETLAAAATVTTPGPRLQAQVERLQAQLKLASTPIEVALHSDGKTRILLYRVGDLGQFVERRLQLLPGVYTLVGRCVGYRDVRIEFTVRASMPPVPPIHCEERI